MSSLVTVDVEESNEVLVDAFTLLRTSVPFLYHVMVVVSVFIIWQDNLTVVPDTPYALSGIALFLIPSTKSSAALEVMDPMSLPYVTFTY